MYSFSYLEPVCCSMSSSNSCFLTCIQTRGRSGGLVFPSLSEFSTASIMSNSLQTDYNPPGSSFHGIFQARILECVAMSSSRGLSWPKNQIRASYIFCSDRDALTTSTTWEATLPLANYLIFWDQVPSSVEWAKSLSIPPRVVGGLRNQYIDSF